MPFKSFVTILVPVLNEEKYIRRAITSIVPSDESLDYELIVLDGGSTDRTKEIVEELCASNWRIRLACNDARIQSAGINRGVCLARPESNIIVRADAHAEYPPGYIKALARELHERKAASVVVPMRTSGNDFLQRAIAAAQNSRIGNGGSPHRGKIVQSRFVDHGHHAAFDRQAFSSIGGYDESFTHNEDAEFDARLTKSGAKIWLCSNLVVTYFPRNSLASLARQYFKHGSGRARTVFKHHSRPKIRQLLPLVVLGVNLGSLGLTLGFGWPFLTPALAYFGACAIWSVILARREGDAACWVSGFAAMIMHQSWAVGFICRSILILTTHKPKILGASAKM
jgi:succinoglycan biosynthesis protein ExoA